MTRRFVDYMGVVFCCKWVRGSYLCVVLFSIWGCVSRDVQRLFCFWAPRRMPTHMHPPWSEKRSQSHRVDYTRRRSVGSFLICLSRGFFIAVLVTYWRDHISFLALRQLYLKCHREVRIPHAPFITRSLLATAHSSCFDRFAFGLWETHLF